MNNSTQQSIIGEFLKDHAHHRSGSERPLNASRDLSTIVYIYLPMKLKAYLVELVAYIYTLNE